MTTIDALRHHAPMLIAAGWADSTERVLDAACRHEQTSSGEWAVRVPEDARPGDRIEIVTRWGETEACIVEVSARIVERRGKRTRLARTITVRRARRIACDRRQADQRADEDAAAWAVVTDRLQRAPGEFLPSRQVIDAAWEAGLDSKQAIRRVSRHIGERTGRGTDDGRRCRGFRGWRLAAILVLAVLLSACTGRGVYVSRPSPLPPPAPQEAAAEIADWASRACSLAAEHAAYQTRGEPVNPAEDAARPSFLASDLAARLALDFAFGVSTPWALSPVGGQWKAVPHTESDDPHHASGLYLQPEWVDDGAERAAVHLWWMAGCDPLTGVFAADAQRLVVDARLLESGGPPPGVEPLPSTARMENRPGPGGVWTHEPEASAPPVVPLPH